MNNSSAHFGKRTDNVSRLSRLEKKHDNNGGASDGRAAIAVVTCNRYCDIAFPKGQ